MARNQKKKRNKKKQPAAAAKQITAEPNLWDRQSPTVQHAFCLVLLAVISFTFFAPIHFKGMSLFAYDTVSFKAMSNEMTQYKAETGETALWSPNPFGGMPGYMISSPVEVKQLDDIPRFLRTLIWPSSHFLFMLWGTYLLAFVLVSDKWASMLAAVAYSFTTYVPIILVAGHNSKFITMAFAPWLILAFVFALRKPGVLSSFLFAIALAINLRAGHIQITYYVAFVMAIWWLVEVVGAYRSNNVANIAKSTGWLAFGSVLGILMVAQPFLSNFEYKAHTIRGASPGGEAGGGGLSWAYAMNWSQGIGELITLIISDAYGGASAYWGPKPPTGGPHYVGGIVMALAVFAGFTVRKRAVLALSIAAILLTLFALGRHFELLNRFMFNFFPLFSSFRVPETWLAIVSLVLALLAAFGFKQAFESLRTTSTGLPTLFKTMGAALAVMLVLFTMKDVFFAFEKEGEREMFMQRVASQNNVSVNNPQVATAVDRALVGIKADRGDRYAKDAIRTILMLLGASLVFFLFQKGSLAGFVAGFLIFGLVAYDLIDVGKRYFVEERLTTEQTADALVAEYGFDTYLINKKNELGGNGHFRVLSLEGNLVEVARPAYHYETLSGYHGAKLRYYQDYLENILFKDSVPHANGLDLLNTRYVIVPRGQLPDTRMVYQDPQTGMQVLERENALPRAYFVGNTEVITSAEETWSRLQSDAFNLATTAILPAELPVTTSPVDSASVATAVLEKHTPHEISWRVNTDTDRLLVVSEVYYPDGWKAYVDDVEVPIHRVNYLIRGVQIPAGEHQLTMAFDPSSYKLGYWVSLLSTLLAYGAVIGLVGYGYFRRKDQ
ncbi:MAG: YfhO family protein [Bacteroidota bacterium]